MSAPRQRSPFAFLAAAPSLHRTAPRLQRASRTFPPRAALQPQGDAARIPAGAEAPSRAAPATAPDADHLSQADAFSWTEQWYAVAFEADILKRTPFACTLFDTALVVFRDSPVRYSALRDRCPHRMAPLSEGRIVRNDDGCADIECAYHGWQFRASGACTRIPQLAPGAAIPRAASVRAYPATAERGIVFVWLEDPARATSATVPLPAHVRGYADRACAVGRKFTTVLPYSYETLVENIADPCHLQFAHHGASPFMNRGGPFGGNTDYEMPVRGAPGIGAFSGTWGMFGVDYAPPALVSYNARLPGVGTVDLLYHVSPAGRRASRVLLTAVLGEATPLRLRLFEMVPRWVQHLHSLTVLDGDTPLLRGVERALRDPRRWSSEYGPPAGEADGAVRRFRLWMDDYRDDMPWEGPEREVEVGETMLRRELNDRLKYHTEECTACEGALRGWERAKKVAAVLRLASMMGLVSAGMIAVLAGASVVPAAAWSVLARTGAVLLSVVLCFALVERLCAWYKELLTNTGNSRQLYLTAKDRHF